MTSGMLDVLEAARLPALCRGVCLYAGLPLPPATAPGQRFIVRSGTEPPEFLAHLLMEAFVEDDVTVEVPDAEGESAGLTPGGPKIAVRPGHPVASPPPGDLRQAVRSGDDGLFFAVERRDEAGRLLGVTWAAVAGEEPPPHGFFRAAVTSCEYDPPR